jgi:SAM-dependent methyltransferase
MSDVRDQWAAGSKYEDFMGRWSRLLAPRFVSWLGVPDRAHWLDVGCGTGAMTSAICAHASPSWVVGCDPAAPFIEYAREHVQDSRASFVVGGIDSLPPPHRHARFRSVTSLLVLNFFPDAEAAVRVMRLRTNTGGVVSACVWDYADGMQFLRRFWDAAVSFDPAAAALDEGRRFPLCHPAPLVDLFAASGLRDVKCEAIDIPTEFASFDDYWRPLLGGTGPAPSYVASLDEERRAELARRIEQNLPRTSAGAIALRARAWAVRGTAHE